MKKFNNANLSKVMNIISKYRLVAQREKALKDAGFETVYRTVGTGGVGKIITRKDYIYVQYAYAKQRKAKNKSFNANMAECVIMKNANK